MRRVGIAVVVLAALLALAVVFYPHALSGLGFEAERPGAGSEGPSSLETDEAKPAPGSLASAGQDVRDRARSALERAPRGRSSIVGVVRLGTKPVAATVELFFSQALGPDVSSDDDADRERELSPPPIDPPPAQRVTADREGRYGFDGVGVGTWLVRASADSVVPVTAGTMVEIPADGARITADLSLARATGVLAGRAVEGSVPWHGTIVVYPYESTEWHGVAPLGTAIVTTDADGRFVARGLVDGKCTPTAYESGRRRVDFPPVVVPHDGELLLDLGKAAKSVSGRVVADADGAPIAGAEVICRGWSSSEESSIVVARTSADGQFSATVPFGARPSVQVWAEGFAPASTSSETKDGPLVIRMTRAATLVGRVIGSHGGAPVAGAIVQVRIAGGLDGRTHDASALTDDAGRYRVADLSAGAVRVRAFAPGLASRRSAAADGRCYDARLVAGETTTVDVSVGPAAQVRGRVVTPDGTPAAAAVVTASEAYDAGDLTELQREAARVSSETSAATAADGTFRLIGLTAGATYDLTAQSGGLVGRASRQPVAAIEERPPVEIVLQAGRTVVVTVVDDVTSAPVPGAIVIAGDDEHPPSRTATSGPDGTALVGPISVEPTTVGAKASGYATEAGAPLGGDATSATVRLRRGLAIAGRVTLPDGRPAVGASVGCHSWCTNGSSLDADASADANGAFRLLGCPPGDWDLTARIVVDDVELEGEVSAHAGRDDIVITVAKSDARSGGLHVRVVDATGEAIPFAYARFVPVGESFGSPATVKDGVAWLWRAGGQPGRIEVWAAADADGNPSSWGAASLDVTGAETDDPVVRLAEGKTIVGVVVDPSGHGVPDASVVVVPTAAARDDDDEKSLAQALRYRRASFARTTPDGRFVVRGLAAEAFVLKVAAAGFARAAPIEVAAGAADVRVVLERGASAVIHVRDADGKPVVGSTVMAIREQTPGRSERHVAAVGEATETRGDYRLDGLDAGASYLLTVEPPRARNDVMPRSTPSWRVAETTANLTRAYVIRGVVKDRSGAPVADARVRWSVGDDDGHESTDEDGRFVFGRLPKRTVALCAWVGEEREGSPPPTIDVEPSREDVVLVIDRGVELVVVIEGLTAKSAPLVTVYAETAKGLEQRGANWLQNGSVRFPGLAGDERLTIWAHSSEAARYALKSGVSADVGKVQLEAQTGKTIRVAVSAPDGATRVGVWSERSDGLSADSVAVDGSTFEVRGIPDGVWALTAWGQDRDKHDLKAEGKASTGESITLRLEPEKQDR